MEIPLIWLFRITSAHLLVNFIIQPLKWIEARKRNHHRAPEFWYLLSLNVLITAWFTSFDSLWVPVATFVLHGLIFWWESYRPVRFHYQLIGEALHLSVIFIIWNIRFPNAFLLLDKYGGIASDGKSWIILTTAALLSHPAGNAIGLLTKSFREKIDDHNSTGLTKAGTWIGILERLIIFSLVMADRFEPIGLLIAAKSIIRLKEGDQKMSEYILIGTLLSMCLALIAGLIVSALLKHDIMN